MKFTKRFIKMIACALVLLLLAACATAAPTATPVPPMPTKAPATATPIPPTATPEAVPPKVLMMLREGSADMELMLTKEVAVEVSMLEEAGFEVILASASGEPFVGTKTTVVPDLKLAEVKVANYAGMIIACMAAGVPGPIPAEAVEIVREVVAEGKPLAAQYGSLFILQEAGALEGKKYAFENARFSGGIYSGTGVVQDGYLITSGTCPYQAYWTGRPDGTRKLTQTFIDLLAHP